MDNYKFTTLLEATPISEEDRYNLATIFRALSDMRKQDIIDHWDVYLSRILEIHNKGEVEKKVLIASTFQHINTLIDEAYMREQERKKLNQLEAKEREKEMLAMMKYNQDKRLKMIKNLSEKEQKARTILDDPLTYL
ncbi:hypothetical protein KBC86_04345 [Candidatus Gracilibacteria bacterium]|nr:hypothetical protein [Candidatus Gracilibacteria bacterium]